MQQEHGSNSLGVGHQLVGPRRHVTFNSDSDFLLNPRAALRAGMPASTVPGISTLPPPSSVMARVALQLPLPALPLPGIRRTRMSAEYAASEHLPRPGSPAMSETAEMSPEAHQRARHWWQIARRPLLKVRRGATGLQVQRFSRRERGLHKWLHHLLAS